MSRIRQLLKQIGELEIGDLINSALFDGQGKSTLGDPDRREPDILIDLPKERSWVEIGEAVYGEEHKEELSLLQKRKNDESLVSNISTQVFSSYSVLRGFQFVSDEKSKKTYAVTEPVILGIVHRSTVDHSNSTIQLFPTAFKTWRVCKDLTRVLDSSVRKGSMARDATISVTRAALFGNLVKSSRLTGQQFELVIASPSQFSTAAFCRSLMVPAVNSFQESEFLLIS
jgi:hypothetical protein